MGNNDLTFLKLGKVRLGFLYKMAKVVAKGIMGVAELQAEAAAEVMY
jgi:hypothetical protein